MFGSSPLILLLAAFIFPLANAADSSPFLREKQRMKAEAAVNGINRSQREWTAKVSQRFAEMSDDEFHGFLGVPLNDLEQNRSSTDLASWRANVSTMFKRNRGELPKQFDARQHWPECADVIGKIQNQARCGSCWAVSAASAIQDRICIANGGRKKVEISAQDILSCTNPSFGCQGGLPGAAFAYWASQGVCTGSPHQKQYAPSHGCKPYPFSPEDGVFYVTPRCERQCENQFYRVRYNQDKHYARRPMDLQKANEEDVKMAILMGGPVTANMIVYSEFLHYKSGVYRPSVGARPAGGHAVRVIGWGQEEGGTPYWLVANSWSNEWGMDGYFRIARGIDACRIESWGIGLAQPEVA